MNQKNTACPDCGTSQVNHASEYATVAIEQLFAPFEGGLNACWNLIHKHAAPLVDRFMPHVLNAAVAAGFARRLTEPDPIEDELLLQCLWAEAKKRDITIYQYALKTGRRGICVAYHNGVPHYFERLPRPKGPCSKAIHWMDDKSRVKEHVLAAGLPAARGGACFLFAQAEHFFRTLEAPFVVKPHTGSATRHTTMNIHTLDELRSAFAKAKQLSPLVMVEEQLVGPVYRITLIGGKVAGVIRRDQPQVVADGVRTVRALWEEENKNPKRHGWVFSPIAEGEMVDRELERQGYTWQSVPPTGTTVFFHPKINWGIGGTTTNCTDSTHPENIALFEKIGTVVNDPLVGIDFLIEDISKPHSSQKRYGVIEANSLPFIDNHHLPFNGEPRNVAGALLDLVFPEATA
jgi:D-alanine-D-alanine ligase-like ATP-grasp enzyme